MAVSVGACDRKPRAPTPRPTAEPAAPVVPEGPDPDALDARRDLPAERRAIQVVHGKERVVDADEARARGLTIIDLSDGWAPGIFDDATAADGTPLLNRYRAVYVGLANDRGDGDGRPLPPGEKNYLELYGIPPSLSVLRARFLADAERNCETAVDAVKLRAVDQIRTWGAESERAEHIKHFARAKRMEAARVKAEVDTLEALGAKDKRWKKELDELRRFEAEQAAFAEVEKRLVCEGLLDATKHKAGSYDTLMRFAVLDFQQKNTVMAEADLSRSTLDAMTEPVLEHDWQALRRVITERAAFAGNVIEDGSVALPVRGVKNQKPATFKTEDGDDAPVPDLVGQAAAATLARLGLASASDALAFFRRHPPEDFAWLKVAVRLPPAPPYYGPHMDLSVEIDRGDIWYDFPFDAKGQRLPQPRERYPSFTLFVKWKGAKVPLVRWRTTIGSWRGELAADGEEYLRYKDSDVGPRVWRQIVAAPVWIPPPSSPLGGMVKEKWVNGAVQFVTNYDETGPGYLSAYGLAAAIHVQVGKRPDGTVTYFDNGIRTHGSFDYMSLRGRFSHGCHRLYNNLALRLYTWVLSHRKKTTLGPLPLGFRRTFFAQGRVFEMRLPTRGFYYELDPPLPVDVLEGTVKGTVKKPISGYMRKPGVVYRKAAPPPVNADPESKAGGGAAP